MRCATYARELLLQVGMVASQESTAVVAPAVSQSLSLAKSIQERAKAIFLSCRRSRSSGPLSRCETADARPVPFAAPSERPSECFVGTDYTFEKCCSTRDATRRKDSFGITV